MQYITIKDCVEVDMNLIFTRIRQNNNTHTVLTQTQCEWMDNLRSTGPLELNIINNSKSPFQ